MVKRCQWRYVFGLLAITVIVFPVWAQEASGGDEATLAQLRAQLAAQQERLAALQAELVQSGAQNQDAARADLMRKQIREILGEQEFRESLMPSMLQAGYDKGFFIRGSDDKFLLKVNGRMQFRWTHYGTRSDNRYLLPRQERDDYTGFDLRRIRLHFSGHAYTPDLTYFLKLFADSPRSYDFGVLYGWLNYRFMDEFQVKAGLFQLAGTRASFNSSANMQFVEYPVVDAVFSTGTGVGVRFWGQLFDKKLEYFLDIVNSLNGAGNRTITPDPAELDGTPAIAFRAVWHACGDVPTRDFVSWADVEFKEVPCVDVGFHYAFTDDYGDAANTRIVFNRDSMLDGGFGVTTSDGLQINQFGLDAAFKYQGFSLAGEYICRLLDVRRAGRTPFTPLWLLTGETSTVAQHGAYVQMGYFLPIPGMEKKVEAVARVGGISVNTEGSEGTWTYAAGLNYYLEGNRVKLQTDVTKVAEVPISANSWLGNVNDDALIWRIQLQVAF
ncbi:MAG: porin [Planctomycetota bacterium]